MDKELRLLEDNYQIAIALMRRLESTYNNSVIEINANSFKEVIDGVTYDTSLQIKTPGLYRLTEDIIFNPNQVAHPSDSGDPNPAQFISGSLDPMAFGIGFFAAIVVTASNVIIDLNGHMICHALAHQIQQRFFSVIELANAAFIPKQGPHDFTNSLIAANNVHIKNGRIANSAHHGIHGNNNKNIIISDVIFEGYEIAACSLNNVNGLYIDNCTAKNSTSIPILGSFSASRFIRPYLKAIESSGYSITTQLETTNLASTATTFTLPANTIKGIRIGDEFYFNDTKIASVTAVDINARIVTLTYVGGQSPPPNDSTLIIKSIHTASRIQQDVRDEHLKVHTHLITNKKSINEPTLADGELLGLLKTADGDVVPIDTPYYANYDGVLDGNAYGFVVNGAGMATLGFPKNNASSSKNVRIKNVIVQSTKAKVSEVKAHTTAEGSPMNDPIGAILQIIHFANRSPEKEALLKFSYVMNPIALAQLVVAKAINGGFNFGNLSTKRNTITNDIISWTESNNTFGTGTHSKKTTCNGDSMHHVNKGIVVFKMDALDRGYLYNCRVFNVENLGLKGKLADGNDAYNNSLGKSNASATYNGYGGANARAFSLASSRYVKLENCEVNTLTVQNGLAIGCDIHLDTSDIHILNMSIKDVISYDSTPVISYDADPTPRAAAIGIRRTNTTYNIHVDKCNINMERNLAALVKYVPRYDQVNEIVM